MKRNWNRKFEDADSSVAQLPYQQQQTQQQQQ
jgi:hypothetical protein